MSSEAHVNLRLIYGSLLQAQSPCCNWLIEEWKKNPVLKGYTALLNAHITLATLVLINTILASGVQLTVTCSPELVCHNNIKQKLIDAGVKFLEHETLKNSITNEYDIAFDCGATLANDVSPRYGFIELTHVNEERYNNVHTHILNIDSGILKLIETTFGTGDGFVRAINYLCQQKNADIKRLNFVLFGFGKVGRGILYSLRKIGLHSHQITIVERNLKLLEIAQNLGYQTLSLDHQLELIRETLKNTDCVITATGIANAISNTFDGIDFTTVEYLANMGTYDEWGDKFGKGRILNNKKPLNFMLEVPTSANYIDPIFALLIYSAVDRIHNQDKRPAQITNVNPSIEKPILDHWIQYNNGSEEYELIKRWNNLQ